jgi:imidazoleglycerol-phosphate dehydratase
MRTAEINRKTAETDIALRLNLDGDGNGIIDTSVPFLDHMLTLFKNHSRFDLSVSASGDIKVDYHHTTEDVGICLGKAFKEALGDKAGIRRYGDIILPMDEALIMVATDLSGRAFLSYDVELYSEKVGSFDTELIEEFMQGFTREAGINLHIKKLSGKNSHHIIEGVFKALARALRKAAEIDPRENGALPSTKGVL